MPAELLPSNPFAGGLNPINPLRDLVEIHSNGLARYGALVVDALGPAFWISSFVPNGNDFDAIIQKSESNAARRPMKKGRVNPVIIERERLRIALNAVEACVECTQKACPRLGCCISHERSASKAILESDHASSAEDLLASLEAKSIEESE